MQSVHYFPRYSLRENVVTNNTLLLFLRLMDYSRSQFEEFLTRLAGDADLEFAPQWLRIGQQRKTRDSVVDGYLAQDSFKIAVETKLTSHFDLAQLERHLSTFNQEDHRLLILLSPIAPARAGDLNEFCRRANERRISVLVTTFERIIGVMRSILSTNDDRMMVLIDDFEAFCDDAETQLLPSDRFKMFTPPCRRSLEDNLALRLYYCKAETPLRRARYLGIYSEKAVRAVGLISKVVECDISMELSTVQVLNGVVLTEEEIARILWATSSARKYDWVLTRGHRFYLCDEWSETNYRKKSYGGIYSARMLDLRDPLGDRMPNSVSEIAKGLETKEWE
jgi:hypothetical protein